MSKACEICKERFMCDRLEYACPRLTFPVGGSDELDEANKRDWAALYKKLGYAIPEELKAYV